MVRGLVRKNNLSDLLDPIKARANLGLADADYQSIRGLFTSAGVSSLDLRYIAGSQGNYQQQINTIFASISGIDFSAYADKSGATLSGTWTNVGSISAAVVQLSGVTPTASTDALFTATRQGDGLAIFAATVSMPSGLTVSSIASGSGIIEASGITPNRLVPIKLGAVQYYLEAG